MGAGKDMDATLIVSSQPDFLQGGVTERRVQQEVAAYRKQVEALDHEYERRHIALDRVFITRITGIAADPFITFASDRVDESVDTEPPV